MLARLAPGVFVALAFVYVWPLALHPGWVAYPPGSRFSDLLLNHLPNALYWRESLFRYGQWPLWNELIYAGLPFAADPLAGIWYPPALLLLVLPLPFGINLLLALHLAWAGYGMFRFLRADGLGAPASALGAVAFAGTPKLVAHLGAGHVSLVYAVAWTPWLLLAARRAVRQDAATVRNGVARGVLAGAVMAAVFLADVRWAYFAGVLVAAYGIVTWQGRVRRAASLAAIIGFAVSFLLLSAVLALPLAELVAQASRSAMTLADGAAYSLPWRYLIGLLIPDLHGFHEWMTYVGVVPLLLSVGGIGRRNWFWVAVAVAAAAYSLGTNFILFPVALRLLPLAGLLRVPPRAWFLVALAAAVLAAHGMQRLLDSWLPPLARRYAANKIRLPSAQALGAALLVLTALDLARVDGTLLDVRPMPLVPAAAWLQQQAGLFRVYTPTFSLPIGGGLQQVGGVDPLQLTQALKLIEPAIGVKAAGYSVVVPAYGPDAVARGVVPGQPAADLLARLDVKYAASEFDLTGPGWERVQDFGDTRVYLNRAWSSRAWVDLEDAKPGQGPGPATVTFWSPNRVEVKATGPGRLVLSEIDYPGWQARVDGQPAVLETADGALRSVGLAAGPHVVTFVFWPVSVYVGAGLSALGLIGLAILAWQSRRA